MPRPCKCRRIGYLPGVTYFKPAGIPMRDLQEVCLSLSEVEAIRLKDLQGLEQAPAAEKMNVSRPTFQRILASARHKIADVLLNGKALKIEGGNFEISLTDFKCIRGHEWSVTCRPGEEDSPAECPVCCSPGVPVSCPSGEEAAADEQSVQISTTRQNGV